MCDAVVAATRPPKVTCTCKVCAVRSRSTRAEPVPSELVGGLSAGPLRSAKYTAGPDAPWSAEAVGVPLAETRVVSAREAPSATEPQIRPLGRGTRSSHLASMDVPPELVEPLRCRSEPQ